MLIFYFFKIMELNLNSQINNGKENKKSEIDILEELLAYIIDKTNKNENNIFLQFLHDPNIINKEEFLIKFMNEMINQLKLGNNIIIPFLDICPTLIKAYINSNLDEEKELKYIEVFKLLKINSFISREYLLPIYEYFSDLFYIINKIKEGDKILKKFNKVFELWKIFYELDINENELKYFNISSYCFIGGGFEYQLSNEFEFKNDCYLIINIRIINFYEFNEKLILFEYENKPFLIKYNEIIESNNNKSINEIIYMIKKDSIKIILEIKDKNKDNNLSKIEKEFEFDFEDVKKFYLLKNFDGQIKFIQIAYITKTKTIKQFFYPYIMNDNKYLQCDTKKNLTKKNEIVKYNISIVINQNLVKANYINYLDNNLNLCEYFGGVIPFIPFISLINRINKNENIKYIGEFEKKYFLNFIFYNIVYLFIY